MRYGYLQVEGIAIERGNVGRGGVSVIMKEIRSEEGMVMVEAIYVVVIAIMIIFFTINIGSVYYNRIAMTAAANEAAAGVASNYGSPNKEPFFNYTGTTDLYLTNPYRYWISGEKSLDQIAQKKAKWYAGYLVSEMEFFKRSNMDFSGIQVSVEENDAGSRNVTVSVKRKFDVFAVNPFLFFGLNPQYEVQVTGSAVCYDVIHEMNNIAFVDEMQKKIGGKIPVVNNVVSMIRKLIDLWK